MKRLLACILCGAMVLSGFLTPDLKVLALETSTVARAIIRLDPPVVADVTASTVTLEYTDGHQYSKDDGSHWQNSAVFSGLKADQEYQFCQRIAGKGQSRSTSITVTTKSKRPCSVPAPAPQLDYCTSNSIKLVNSWDYEYRINGGAWSNAFTFVNLKPDTEYIIEQRYKETGEEFAGEPGEPLVVKTLKEGRQTAIVNHDKVLDFIEANGTEDEEQNKFLALTVTDEDGAVYYFLLIKDRNDMDYTMELVYDGAAVTGLAFDLKLEIQKAWTTALLRLDTYVISQDTIVDNVYETQHLAKQKINDSYTFTSDKAGTYLTAEDVSMLGDGGLKALLFFWDEVLYEELGFGMRGLGFISYNGKGVACCDLKTGAHVGGFEVRDQREAGCSSTGSLGYRYCLTCGEKVEDLGQIQPTETHTYDNNCDTDCNNCGVLRRTRHRYLFACAENCSVCQTKREQVYASHKPDSSGTCTHCGEKVPICGDITGEGKVNMGDVARLYSHIRGTSPITDPDALAAADVTGDGKINLGDTARVLAHITGKNPLF